MNNPRNIEEYVVKKILEYMDEIKKKDKEIKKLKNLLRNNKICFECVCSKCNRKIEPEDETHSHNSNLEFPTLCYSCFFKVL